MCVFNLSIVIGSSQDRIYFHANISLYIKDICSWPRTTKEFLNKPAAYPRNRELSNQPNNKLTNQVRNDTTKQNTERENNKGVNQDTDGPTWVSDRLVNGVTGQ
jgi:hypothetical protein